MQEVDRAGPAPVEGGNELAQDVRDQLTDLREDVADARAHVERTDPNDAATVGQAVAAGGNVVTSLGNSAQAISAISGDDRVRPAFEQAESCERFRTMGGA